MLNGQRYPFTERTDSLGRSSILQLLEYKCFLGI
jgi:hypothetical protein